MMSASAREKLEAITLALKEFEKDNKETPSNPAQDQLELQGVSDQTGPGA